MRSMMEQFHNENQMKDGLSNNLIFEEKSSEVEVSENVNDNLAQIVICEKDESLTKGNNASTEVDLCRKHCINTVENLHGLCSSLSDEYSSEKFGQDVMQLIEHGETWHDSGQVSGYRSLSTESFSTPVRIESTPIAPIQQYLQGNISSMKGSTLTLTLLNSTSSDDSQHAVIYGETGTNDKIADHNYCGNHKAGQLFNSDYGVNDNDTLTRIDQSNLQMDQEKLLRMKRRKEKNRECSRQFRLKQKHKEESLRNGKVEKARELDSLRRSVENWKETMSKVASYCCAKCPTTRQLLSRYTLDNKENINPQEHIKTKSQCHI